MRDPSETPRDQPAADADREQGHAGSNQDGDHLRKARLQPVLYAPYSAENTHDTGGDGGGGGGDGGMM